MKLEPWRKLKLSLWKGLAQGVTHAQMNDSIMCKQTNQSLGCNQRRLSITWEKPAAVPLSFVETENKEISDGISSYDLYEYCQNTSETLRWDL